MQVLISKASIDHGWSAATIHGAMADTPSNVSDELYQALRQHFSEEQLIELAASAARENFRARFNRVFNVGSDHLYRKGLQFKQRRAA